MKIRTWLLISFFIVMILPLLSAYLLFASIASYHNDQRVEEYYEAYANIQDLKNVLNDQKWYDGKIDKAKLNELSSDEIAINLYNINGLKLYSSVPSINLQNSVNQTVLYKNLYEMEEGLKAFTYKEPVFNEHSDVIGFFTIEIARDELISTIVRRGWIVIALFITSFIIIYAGVSLVVHRRLNKRLYGLMDEMSAFAGGKLLPQTPIGKDEIGELKSHFYTMREQITAAQTKIREEQKEKEYMVAAISHDLKTPLTSIKAYTEILSTSKEELTEQEKLTYQHTIMEKSDYMKQMLDDLMVYSLLQSKEYELELVEVDGEEFFDMIVSDYEALCEEKHLQLTASNYATGKFKVNPKQFIRVADNLMTNAIRHTPSDGSLWITVVSEASQLENWLFDAAGEQYVFDFTHFAYLIVQNEGAGISAEKISHLFEPLFQTDQARSKKDAHGSGLGLSITKQIIDKHGGSITAISKEGYGACFICSIPKGEMTDE